MQTEPTTPAFAQQVTTLRLTVYLDDVGGIRAEEAEVDELASVFFDAIRPAIEAFSNRHGNTLVVVTP